MPKHTTADRAKAHVVIVTLDNHITGAVARVGAELARDVPGLFGFINWPMADTNDWIASSWLPTLASNSANLRANSRCSANGLIAGTSTVSPASAIRVAM